jgi:hypothetical protein
MRSGSCRAISSSVLAATGRWSRYLALVLQHEEQAVLCAVELALDAGVPTKTHILNLLYRLIDGKPTSVAAMDAPQALELQREPKANVERYDTLRGKRLRHAS